jgi:hypothetical protein
MECGKWSIALLLLLFSCTHGNTKSKPEKPNDEIKAVYDIAVTRLLGNHLEDGWVVSRYEDGRLEHVGDSLIWSGIALAALPCDKGDAIELALTDMILMNEGGLTRFEPLPEEYLNGREISFDGAVGLYYGFLHRLTHCLGSRERLLPIIKSHLAYLRANSWLLNRNANATYTIGFSVLRDLLLHKAGLGEKPQPSEFRTAEGLANIWSSGVIEAGQPCFRVHLAFLHLLAFESTGDLLEGARDTFCYATEEADIPLIDHWCGRKEIRKWADTYIYNEWEYRQQRCGKYETPDGRHGLDTPGLDLAFALAYAYPEGEDERCRENKKGGIGEVWNTLV